nr:hypothetical protein [Tanacetum cinerariifolium]
RRKPERHGHRGHTRGQPPAAGGGAGPRDARHLRHPAAQQHRLRRQAPANAAGRAGEARRPAPGPAR